MTQIRICRKSPLLSIPFFPPHTDPLCRPPYCRRVYRVFKGFLTPHNTLLTPLKPSYVPKALFWNSVFLDLKPENSRYYGEYVLIHSAPRFASATLGALPSLYTSAPASIVKVKRRNHNIFYT
jgi:hypothetical protein